MSHPFFLPHPTAMDKKITSFRCPASHLREMEKMCRKNHMDRSTYITLAIRQLVDYMASQGVIEGLQGNALPPLAFDLSKPLGDRRRGKA